jgi:hypothetical protein
LGAYHKAAQYCDLMDLSAKRSASQAYGSIH